MSGGRQTAVLRGIAHARLYSSAGDGLETIVSKLATGDCGWVSKRFAAMLRAMHKGKTVHDVLGKELQKSEKRTAMRSYALLLGALLAEGDSVDQRLAAATTDVIGSAENLATKNTDRAKFFSKLIAIAMVMCFGPVIYGYILKRASNVIENVPEPNPALPLSISALAICVFAFLMVGRE